MEILFQHAKRGGRSLSCLEVPGSLTRHLEVGSGLETAMAWTSTLALKAEYSPTCSFMSVASTMEMMICRSLDCNRTSFPHLMQLPSLDAAALTRCRAARSCRGAYDLQLSHWVGLGAG